MEIQVLPLIIVVAFLRGMLVVGFIVSKLKIKNSKDYLVAGRRMGLFMVAFSLSANNIGGGCTTGLAQKAFGNWGMSAIWYVLTASIAMIPLAYFAPKIRKTLAVTIPEVVGRRFGKLSSNFTAILSVLSLFCLTSSQIAASPEPPPLRRWSRRCFSTTTSPCGLTASCAAPSSRASSWIPSSSCSTWAAAPSRRRGTLGGTGRT